MPRNNENLTPASVSDNESNGAPRQEGSARSEPQAGGSRPRSFADLLREMYPTMPEPAPVPPPAPEISYADFMREQQERIRRDMEEAEARLREERLREAQMREIAGMVTPREISAGSISAADLRASAVNFWVNWGDIQPIARPYPAAHATLRPMPAPRRRVRNLLHGVTEQIPPGDRAVPDPFYWNHECACGGVEVEAEDYRYKRCTDACRLTRVDSYACPVCGGSGVASGRGPRTSVCGACWGTGRAVCEVCGEHEASRISSNGRPDALCAKCVSDSEDLCSH